MKNSIHFLIPDHEFPKWWNKTSHWHYIFFPSSLIVAIILLLLKYYLAAGVLIIIATASGILFIRTTNRILHNLASRLEELIESSGKKDNVINNFSHRIREPLNNLVTVSELLINSEVEKKHKDLIETLVASTKNMVDIVNELTMQSAESIIYTERKKIHFNIFSTVENTIELFRHKNHHLDFILNRKDVSSFEVIGDPIILKQILLDIFNIIAGHKDETPIKVNISVTRDQKSIKKCLISFRVQVDRDIALIDEVKKIGINSARLIYSSNGSFTTEQGKEYHVLTFTLPYESITEEKKVIIASPLIEVLKKKEKPSKELKDANILLVEDNPINQKITMLTLKPLVKNIDTASDGREALEKFGSSKYDIVLMDIQMPVMGGLIAAEKIRTLEVSTNNHVPIIAITANAMLGDKEKCLSSGMDDYISKPFQPGALIEIIKKHL